MQTYTAVIERDPEAGVYVGYVPGIRGAHSQAETLEKLRENLTEVIEMLMEDAEPERRSGGVRVLLAEDRTA